MMSVYNKEWLINKTSRSEKTDLLFFWGHQVARDGAVTASCFSQWWEASFVVAAQEYVTAEHWMMAKKAALFGDTAIEKAIMQTKFPAEAKKLGRMIQGFDSAVWDEHKYDIVTTGNYHKFGQNTELKNFLLHTGKRILVEASPVDPIWGIGIAATDSRAKDPFLWKGENLLGFALMEVRDQLK